MAIGSISGTGRTGSTLGGSAADLSSVSFNQTQRSRIESVDTVTITTPDRKKQQSLSSALRSLSDLQSFTDAASNATERVGQVIKGTIEITNRLNAEVDPTKRQQLADEGEALLEEIDKIVSSAESPQGRSVVAQGQISYSFNLGDSSKSSADSISVQLTSVNIRKSDLGLSGVTSASLKASTDADKEQLEDALTSVSTIAASLDSVSTQISKVADSFSTGQAESLRATEEEAGELAKTISKKVTEADIVQQASNLDPLRVADLLNGGLDEIPPKKEEEEEAVQASSSGDDFP